MDSYGGEGMHCHRHRPIMVYYTTGMQKSKVFQNESSGSFAIVQS